MVVVTAVVLAMLSGGFLVPADEPQAEIGELQFVRLKPADPEIRRLIVDGHHRSEAFRALIDEIQRSSVVVIIQFGLCANGRFRSCVTNVDGDGRQRNIRVKINTRTTDDRLIATVAHELRHVVEILGDADATSAERTLALYRRIGEGNCRAGLSEACETRAALDAEQQVLQELNRASRVAR